MYVYNTFYKYIKELIFFSLKLYFDVLVNVQEGNKNKLWDKPWEYIQYLSQPDLNANKMYNCVKTLRVALTNHPLSWISEFGTEGLRQLLSVLNECYRK